MVGSVVGLQASFEDPLSFLPESMTFFFEIELQDPTAIEHFGIFVLAEIDDLKHDVDCLLPLPVRVFDAGQDEEVLRAEIDQVLA